MNDESSEIPAKKKIVKLQPKIEQNIAPFDRNKNFLELRQYAIDELSDEFSVEFVKKERFIVKLDEKKFEITNALILRVIFPAEIIIEIACSTKLTIPAFDNFLKRFMAERSIKELFAKCNYPSLTISTFFYL